MKTEADFKDGDTVIFDNQTKTASFTGTVDYSYGDELPGHIRVQMFSHKISGIGNTVYVPVELIRDTHDN